MDIKVDKNTVIVFDLDDTLYNELDFLISAFKDISKRIDKFNSEQVFSIMLSLYRNNENVFEFLNNNYSIKKHDLIEIYRNHYPTIKLNPHVRNFIDELKNKKINVALLTDGRSITQRNKISSLGLENVFDYISISEEIGFKKPSSKGFQLIENFFKKKKYYYIADNLEKDFIAPKKRGWYTICILDNGKNIHYPNVSELIVEKKPNSYVFSFNELKII